MTLAKIALGTCAALALVAAGVDADAKGGSGGSGGGGHGGHSGGHAGGHHSHGHHTAVSGGSHHHGGHGYTSVFMGAGFVLWPAAYYWPDYYPGAGPSAEYWYYCQPYAAYYPYVQECPTQWQLVLPTAPSPES